MLEFQPGPEHLLRRHNIWRSKEQFLMSFTNQDAPNRPAVSSLSEETSKPSVARIAPLRLTIWHRRRQLSQEPLRKQMLMALGSVIYCHFFCAMQTYTCKPAVAVRLSTDEQKAEALKNRTQRRRHPSREHQQGNPQQDSRETLNSIRRCHPSQELQPTEGRTSENIGDPILHLGEVESETVKHVCNVTMSAARW